MNSLVIISHRGLLFGKDSIKENTLPAIKKAISLGFDCEIDIFRVGKQFYLGHDGPKYKVSHEFLLKNCNKLWLHCKDFQSLEDFENYINLFNYFWHDTDFHTITSRGFIITHQDQPKTVRNGILVMKDKPTRQNLPTGIKGIITDWPILAKEIYDKNSHL